MWLVHICWLNGSLTSNQTATSFVFCIPLHAVPWLVPQFQHFLPSLSHLLRDSVSMAVICWALETDKPIFKKQKRVLLLSRWTTSLTFILTFSISKKDNSIHLGDLWGLNETQHAEHIAQCLWGNKNSVMLIYHVWFFSCNPIQFIFPNIKLLPTHTHKRKRSKEGGRKRGKEGGKEERKWQISCDFQPEFFYACLMSI